MRSVTAAIVLAGIGAAAPQAFGQMTDPLYEVIEIPAIPGHPFSQTSRMNSHGHVVGGNWPCPYILSCLGRAFLFDGTATHDFTASLIDGLPPGFLGATRGVDINDTGDVLLWLTIIDVGIFPYLWRDGEEFVEIEGPPGSSNAIAWALNEAGTVVGYFATAAGARAFTWTADDGVTSVIVPPLGYGSSSARGINDAGDVVGAFSDGTGPDIGFLKPASGGLTLLPPLPGHVRSFAIDVNDDRLVAGISEDATGQDSLVVWHDGAVVGSHTPGFETVFVGIQRVSDAGLVVGSFWPTSEARQFAFRWSGTGGFEQLDALDLSSPGLNLWEATGVDGSGRIVVWGEHPDLTSGSFLLTPPSIAGDLDGDGVVAVTDLVLLIANWGPCADPADCPGDLDGDGTVAVTDLVILIGNWG